MPLLLVYVNIFSSLMFPYRKLGLHLSYKDFVENKSSTLILKLIAISVNAFKKIKNNLCFDACYQGSSCRLQPPPGCKM